MLTISEKEFNQLTDFIRHNYGINLGVKKKALVVSRLQNILYENNFSNFTEYYKYVTSDKTGKAIISLLNNITTNYTYFMREADHFNYFKNKVLPYLTKTSKDKDLRIWSAGCSTGEEPYALSMIISDFLGIDKNNWNRELLATDISEKALDVAKKGIYLNNKIDKLPNEWILNYFNKLNSTSIVVNNSIKKEIVFKIFNLMTESFPFKKKFHVIFCRNVMIYFDNDTKNKLVSKFYDCLEYGGYLFIGHSESLNRNETDFKYIMPAIYRKE